MSGTHWTRRPFAKDGSVNVMIETSKGCRTKMKYEPVEARFVLHKVLPAGAAFPYDFGFVPNTEAADGDPLDVLVLMDESVPQGSLVTTRILGAIEAEETVGGRVRRNDRLIGVATGARERCDWTEIGDVGDRLLGEIENFFVSYREMEGVKLECTGRAGAQAALDQIRKSVKA
jgi:inorganic pyrophosphatase